MCWNDFSTSESFLKKALSLAIASNDDGMVRDITKNVHFVDKKKYGRSIERPSGE